MKALTSTQRIPIIGEDVLPHTFNKSYLVEVRVLDYLYYRIYSFYKKRDSTPVVFAITLLSASQTFNLLSLLFLYGIIRKANLPEIGIGKIHFLVVAFGVLGINYLRYGRKNHNEGFNAKWKSEDAQKRKRNGWWCSLYIALSFGLFVGLAVLGHYASNS